MTKTEIEAVISLSKGFSPLRKFLERFVELAAPAGTPRVWKGEAMHPGGVATPADDMARTLVRSGAPYAAIYTWRCGACGALAVCASNVPPEIQHSDACAYALVREALKDDATPAKKETVQT